MDENAFKIEVDKYFDQFDDFIVTCIRIMNHTHVLHGLPCGNTNFYDNNNFIDFVRVNVLNV